MLQAKKTKICRKILKDALKNQQCYGDTFFNGTSYYLQTTISVQLSNNSFKSFITMQIMHAKKKGMMMMKKVFKIHCVDQ